MVCRCGTSKTTTRHYKLEVVVDLYMYMQRRATVNYWIFSKKLIEILSAKPGK